MTNLAQSQAVTTFWPVSRALHFFLHTFNLWSTELYYTKHRTLYLIHWITSSQSVNYNLQCDASSFHHSFQTQTLRSRKTLLVHFSHLSRVKMQARHLCLIVDYIFIASCLFFSSNINYLTVNVCALHLLKSLALAKNKHWKRHLQCNTKYRQI